jgi:cell wall-associated NlpC family hydrolase
MKTKIKATAAVLTLIAITGKGAAYTAAQATTIMTTATNLIGSPYSLGAKGPTKFDCSGLTTWCYKKAGITIPDGSANQYSACNVCVSTSKKAALLFFATDTARPGKVTHVTLNCGDGANSIGANGEGNTGSVKKFNFATNTYWNPKLITCALKTSW